MEDAREARYHKSLTLLGQLAASSEEVLNMLDMLCDGDCDETAAAVAKDLAHELLNDALEEIRGAQDADDPPADPVVAAIRQRLKELESGGQIQRTNIATRV